MGAARAGAAVWSSEVSEARAVVVGLGSPGAQEELNELNELDEELDEQMDKNEDVATARAAVKAASYVQPHLDEDLCRALRLVRMMILDCDMITI